MPMTITMPVTAIAAVKEAVIEAVREAVREAEEAVVEAVDVALIHSFACTRARRRQRQRNCNGGSGMDALLALAPVIGSTADDDCPAVSEDGVSEDRSASPPASATARAAQPSKG